MSAEVSPPLPCLLQGASIPVRDRASAVRRRYPARDAPVRSDHTSPRITTSVVIPRGERPAARSRVRGTMIHAPIGAGVWERGV